MDVLEIKPFDNNAKGWADARKEAIEKLEENTKLADKEKSDELKITVRVSANDFKPESDVVRLQNFLTISDIAKNSYKIKQTYLEVNIVDKGSQNRNDDSKDDKYFQIRQFFCFQTFREDTEFKIDGYVLGAPVAETRSYTKKRSYKGKEEWKLEQIEFRRVIPVVSISNNEGDVFDYRNLVKTTSKEENRKEILKNAHETHQNVKELTKERNKYAEEINALNARLEDEKKPLTPDQQKEINDSISSLEPKVYKLNYKIDEEIKPFILSKQENLVGTYKKLFNLNIMFLYDKIVGTTEKKIKEKNKDVILNEVFDFIVKRCNELPIFAQYIWIVFIRYAMEEKIAFRFDDEENTYHIDEIIFEKFLSDALAYSEGIYQIVENSCIHSCGKTAHISLRLYNVNRSSTIKQLAGVTNTLSRLSDTYQEISQFKDASIYFEITITDSTIGEAGKQLGMIDTYNKKHKNKIEDLQGLFDRTTAVGCREQAEEDVLYHYGLRTFRKIVRVNDGYFIVSSPYNDEQSEEVKHDYYIVSKDEERDEKFDYDKEADDFWAWGESRFKIIIPLKAEWENRREESEQKGNKQNKQKKIITNTAPFFRHDGIDKEYAIEVKTYKSLKVKLDEVVESETDRGKRKKQIVDAWYEIIKSNDKGNVESETIIGIDMRDGKHWETELLTKALMKFAFVDKSNQQNKIEGKDKFAVFFRSREQIVEFVRTYSVFFDRNGINRALYSNKFWDVRDIQIALCMPKSGEGIEKQKENVKNEQKQFNVVLVLSGKNLGSARKVARQYAYYMPEISLDFIPAIDYLTEMEGGSEKGKEVVTDSDFPGIFPFELYLNIKNQEDMRAAQGNKLTLNNTDTWFLRDIEENLQLDMQENGFGCKIEDVRVSIGSKIRINTFYSAELLFQNYGNVCRFAYIAAHDILNSHDKSEKNILLIGYEDYSSLLIQETARLIKERYSQTGGKQQVETLVFSAQGDEIDSMESGWLWPRFSEFIDSLQENDSEEKHTIDDYIFYIVIPVGTTLSTVYKIQNIANRVYHNKVHREENALSLTFGRSIVLVSVGGLLANITEDSSGESKETDPGIGLGYWESVNKKLREIKLSADPTKPYSSESDTYRNVKYYLNVPSVWEIDKDDNRQNGGEQSECSNEFSDTACSDNKLNGEKQDGCLIGVDKTSTFTDSIFELFNNKKGIFERKDKYIEKQKSVKGDARKTEEKIRKFHQHIYYAHIHDDVNHYQYDIDYEGYYNEPDVRTEAQKWLKDTFKSAVPQNAFNIIVSPLDSSTSNFLKDVNDNAFCQNVRNVNIRMHAHHKEEIRTKFSYIIDEYRKIARFYGKTEINIYYVDTCIVSGSTLQRAKQFMEMLLQEAGLGSDKANLYKGIIVLANRSSYETIQNFLPGRVDNDFHYYVRLNVPSYNTLNGTCPGCELESTYELMHKRTATNKIAQEYGRLWDKHKCKAREEYKDWLKKDFFKNKSHTAEWALQWIYYHEVDGKGIKNIFGEPLPIDDLDKIKQTLINLKKNKKTSQDEQERAYQFFNKCVLADRNFMRMYATHDAFSELETVIKTLAPKGDDNNRKDAEKKARAKIISIIDNRFSAINETFKEYKMMALWLKAEWLMSYIKVISRKQLGKYYNTRVAIYGILHELAERLINVKKKYNTDLDDIFALINVDVDNRADTGIMPEMKLKIFLIVIRRLSAMHSSFVIDHVSEIRDFYERCKKQYNEEGEYSYFYEHGNIKETYHRQIGFQSDNEFDFHVAKLMKWIAMSGYDNSKCFVIEKQCLDDSKDTKNVKDIRECKGEKDIYNIAFLENVQILYDGVERLLEGYTGNIDDQEELYAYIDALYGRVDFDNLDDFGRSDNSKRTPVKMSPLYPFFKFMKKEEYYQKKSCSNEERLNSQDNRVEDKNNKKPYEKNKLVLIWYNMCRYFLALKRLAARDEGVRIDNPYDYEEICNCICRITGYERCLIVYRNVSVHCVAESSIPQNHMKMDMWDINLQDLIERFRKANTGGMLNSTLQKYIIRGKERIVYHALVANISRFSNGEREAYIVLYNAEIVEHDDGKCCKDGMRESVPEENRKKQGEPFKECPAPKELWDMRNVLFMRDKLDRLLRMDIVTLNDLTFSSSYVRKISRGSCVRVLHISDLHITKSREKVFSSIIQQWDAPEEIDLLLITGDIITGGYTAMDLIENYDAAYNIILQIAAKLWGKKATEKGEEQKVYIRSDWKKRIVISTGNHDYASMNELKAKNSNRATLSGVINNQMGDTMIKFSYFIDFMRKLLGINIDRAVRYDLNSITKYDELKLTVVNFNSNSGVNPYRTNKVKINDIAIKGMYKQGDLDTPVIYMMHHTPIYRINYLSDIYYLKSSKLIEAAESVKKREAFKELCKEVTNVFYEGMTGEQMWIELLNQMGCEGNFRDEKGESLAKCWEYSMGDILHEFKDLDYKWFIETRLDEIEYYVSVSLENRKADDKCRRVLDGIRDAKSMSKIDQKAYNNFVCEHFSDVKQPYCILGGHTHVAARYKGERTGPFQECEDIIEAGIFFDLGNNKLLRYNIVEVDTGEPMSVNSDSIIKIDIVTEQDVLEKSSPVIEKQKA